MPKRNFADISVTPIGVQNFEGRFGKRRRHEYEDVPPISQWRCNATGLSQLHNLYFVAYGRDVYVYIPQFPAQEISQQPILIIPSYASIPGQPGTLDPLEPHSINNLVVQHLGNEEVIATVRDNGEVVIFLVRHVVQAIARRTEIGNAFGVIADELKPIFQSNVGISAWGLAIHSQARILAKSSNHHEVRVFKFGLLQEDDESLPDESHDTSRRMDVTQRVINGNANIPSIAFCNTGDDPDGRWLLTTDISGYCRVMDLSQTASECVQQFRFGRALGGYGGVGVYDRLNAGWAIMFLDSRSFLPVASFTEALGLGDSESVPGSSLDVAQAWDLSDTVKQTPDNSTAFTYHDLKKSQAQRESVIGPQTSMRPREQSDFRTDTDMAEATHSGSEVLTESTSEADTQTNPDQTASASSEREAASSSSADGDNDDDDGDMFMLDEDADPEDEGTEDSISFHAIYGGKRIFGNHAHFHKESPLCNDLPCPILHASVHNVYLLQPSNQRHRKGAFSPPMDGLV